MESVLKKTFWKLKKKKSKVSMKYLQNLCERFWSFPKNVSSESGFQNFYRNKFENFWKIILKTFLKCSKKKKKDSKVTKKKMKVKMLRRKRFFKCLKYVFKIKKFFLEILKLREKI